MKVIAKTSGGYLVEMSGFEIIDAAGYHPSYTAPREWDRGDKIPIGLTVQFQAGTARLRALAEADEKRKQSSAVLRALADLIDQLEPTKVEEPAPAEPPPAADPEPPAVALAT